MTRCKICGITNPHDALAALEYGADALGFVFYPPSPRYVKPAVVAGIIASLPPFVTTTGLFVNAPATDVARIVAITGLDLLQFHGEESAEFCEQFGRPYIKAIGVTTNTDIESEAKRFDSARALLLDTFDPVLKGGTGRTFDWALADSKLSKPIILAGGLNPANVRKAIEQINPYAVDVSGGVESSKGKKDPERLKAFLSEVHCECKT